MYPVGTRFITPIDVAIPLGDIVPAGMHGTVTHDDDEGWISVRFDQPIEAIEHWGNQLTVPYGNIKTQLKLEAPAIERFRAAAHEEAAAICLSRAEYLDGEEIEIIEGDEPKVEESTA
jgi:hypothetical protein